MHTPGPWFALRCEHGWHVGPQPAGVFSVSDPAPIGSIHDNSDGSKLAEQEANARLIAAAPDLLAACKAAVAAFDLADEEIRPLAQNWADLRAAADAARAAIVNATT